jgi:hypothetical protein
MSSRGHCAICGAEDRFSVGVCVGCAADGRDQRLLIVQPPAEPGAFATVETALRVWLGSADTGDAVKATARGRRIIAVIPAALAGRAAHNLAAAGVPNRVLLAADWYRALPPHFALMLAAIAVAGGLAGIRAASLMLWGTPLLMTLLLLAAWQQLRTPLLRFARTEPVLPIAARTALARALVQLPAGTPRELLLDLARAAEHTYAALPEAFRANALGDSVVELVLEAGSLSVETSRLQAVGNELQTTIAGEQRATSESLEAAVQARIALLGQALVTLGRIARDSADSTQRTSEMQQLIEQLRREQHWRGEGEDAVETLLR